MVDATSRNLRTAIAALVCVAVAAGTVPLTSAWAAPDAGAASPDRDVPPKTGPTTIAATTPGATPAGEAGARTVEGIVLRVGAGDAGGGGRNRGGNKMKRSSGGGGEKGGRRAGAGGGKGDGSGGGGGGKGDGRGGGKGDGSGGGKGDGSGGGGQRKSGQELANRVDTESGSLATPVQGGAGKRQGGGDGSGAGRRSESVAVEEQQEGGRRLQPGQILLSVNDGQLLVDIGRRRLDTRRPIAVGDRVSVTGTEITNARGKTLRATRIARGSETFELTREPPVVRATPTPPSTPAAPSPSH